MYIYAIENCRCDVELNCPANPATVSRYAGLSFAFKRCASLH